MCLMKTKWLNEGLSFIQSAIYSDKLNMWHLIEYLEISGIGIMKAKELSIMNTFQVVHILKAEKENFIISHRANTV